MRNNPLSPAHRAAHTEMMSNSYAADRGAVIAPTAFAPLPRNLPSGYTTGHARRPRRPG